AAPPALLPLAQDARERGWLQAAHSRLESQGLDVGELMSRLSAVRTERLGDWQYLVEPASEGPALLMGDPWGAHMTALSREARPLVVFEPDPEAAQYLRVRAGQESLANVSAIVCGEGARALPFGPETFSMVALVGPWSPGPMDNGSARPLDAIIARAFALLRKGGTFILGVPNLLRPDLALRGRARGQLASTLPALRSRIARGGFESPQVYLPVPDFTDIQGLVSLDSKVALRYFHVVYRHPRARWKRVLLGAAIDAGLIAVAAPSYMAIARKP
ncbi:MAG: hypothetical protein ACE5FC_01525, partial [Myxococcota bacterium]